MNIGNKQIEILKKSNKYLFEKVSITSLRKLSVFLYLNSWDSSSLGNSFLKWKILYQKSSFWFFYRHCKNIFAIRHYAKMTTYFHENSSVNEKYRTLLVSWCNYSDFNEKGFYHDRYFNIDASKYRDVLWLLISTDNKVPSSFQSNVRIYCKDKTTFFIRIYVVFNTLVRTLLSFNVDWHFFMFKISAEKFFADKIRKVVKDLNSKFFFHSVIQAYEAQPYQHLINIELKNSFNRVKTIGYLHSALPPLPTDLIYREGSPDILYVHGKGQLDIMQRLLNWPANTLRFTPSLRFKKNNLETFTGRIFLPYSFSEREIILSGLESYFQMNTVNSLPRMVIKGHPVQLSSKKHILLMKGIETILEKYHDRFDENSQRQISIFIGATAAIIEALERSVEVVHITSDPVFESHQADIWKDIEVTAISQNVYLYKLRKKGCYIQLGNDQEGLARIVAEVNKN